MQPSIKNDIVYLLMMLEAIGKIKIYSKDFNNAQDFYHSNNQLNFDASLMMLATIGEQVSKISDELKGKQQHVPWQSVKDLRNRIIHNYEGIDFELAFYIVKNDLPQLENNIIEIIKIETESGNFLMEEIKIAQSSTFYLHVNFEELIIE